jgi:hypothetical protein
MLARQIHIECIDSKCNYSSKKRLKELSYPRNLDNELDVYGSNTHQFERFKDLGIPVLLLQNEPPSSLSDDLTYSTEDDDDYNVLPITNELFENLFAAVQESHPTKTRSEKKRKSKTGKRKSTRRKKA